MTIHRLDINQLEYDLPRWTENTKHIIVYEDVVAQYNYAGKKKMSRVFTIKWRNESGELEVKRLNAEIPLCRPEPPNTLSLGDPDVPGAP